MSGSRSRWWIVGLLFLATTINYIDRQTLSVLVPTLRQELRLSEQDYANVVTAFLVPYTIMYSCGGRLMDYLGARLGLGLAFAWWSAATMLTGFARGAFSLGVFRALLGIAEPCVFPAGIKSCAEMFLPRERALPVGIFSSGSSVGAVIAPPLVAWITLQFGWRYAFVIAGLAGFCWLPFWLWIRPKRPAQIEPKPAAAKIPWRALLRQRSVWGLVAARFFGDPVWYFYLFWLPDYLQRQRHFSLAEIAAWGWIPFLCADLGSMTGGAISDWRIRRGVAPARARLTVLLAVACLAPVGALAGVAASATSAVAVVCLVAFVTQVWSVNTVTLASDLQPAVAVGTVTGIMGTAGSLGGILFAQTLGFVIARLGYQAAFVSAAVLHPVAAILLILLIGIPAARKAAGLVRGNSLEERDKFAEHSCGTARESLP